MSTTIDQQVVEMRFDNKQFERNVSTTMSSLEKLKQSLNLSGASKGLENVNDAAKRVNLSGISNAAETVGLKFNAMYTMADQALRNITNSAMNAGKRIISALTIDPIKTGLSEYETQINAVQTILANTESKGTTLQQVNSALDELNTYADKTIYNFTEMTRNIGTFTAAGVDLRTSVNAIQGIANLAAVSGSSSQQASTAMYQLSQALSSGTVKLMDWNSVVNAGMGGQVFQDALKETARVHGVNVDAMIKKHGSFRETLQEGWITSDILTETLSHFTMAAEEGSEAWDKYKKSLMDDGYTEAQALAILKMSNTATDAATKVKTATQLWDTLKETAQSGWTQTWEIIMGDFGEAKKLFSQLYETISPMIEATSEARNKLLSEGLSTGWKQLLGQGIADEAGYTDSIKTVAKDHGVAIDEMIKAEKELDSSLDDNEAFQKVLKKGLADGTITSDMLSKSVTNLADKMRGMSDAEMDAAGYTKEHLAQIEKLEKGLKDGSISMDEFVKKMQRPSGRENLIESLMNAFNGLMSVVKPIKEAFSDIFPAMTGEQLYAITEAIRDFTAKLTLSETASDNLKRTFKGLFAIVDIVRQVFVTAVKAISPLFKGVDDLGGGILGVTAKLGDWLVNLNESIKASGFFTTAVEKIHSGLEKVKNFLQPVVNGIKEFGSAISNSFTKISSNAVERLGPLSALGMFIKGLFSSIGKILMKVAPWIGKAAAGIGNVLRDLMDRITSSIQNADYNKLFDVVNGGIMSAIGIFIAKFIKSGGDILDNAGGFLDNINEILGGVSDSLGAFTESLKADTLKKVATAIAILAASLFVLSLIDSEKLTLSLVAVTTLFGELMASMSLFGKISGTSEFKGVTKIAGAMIALSSALLILSVAMKIMSTMSWSEMGVGLISITVGIAALVGAVNLLPEKKVNDAAKAIKKLTTSLLILAVAVKIMSTMSWSEMGVGLITMVVGLGALVGAVNLLPKDTSIRAAGMIGLATSMVVLGAALKIMATMSWDDIARSLVTLGVSLGLLVGAMALMKNAIPGAMAIKVVAPAIVILAAALKIMATMSWEEIAKGLVSLAGSLTILAIAMLAMKNAIPGALAMKMIAPSLIVFSIALKMLGSMSWEEIARGLTVLAGAFIIIGVAAAVLTPLVGTILALSTALITFGIACAAIGVGVLAIGLGLTAIATAGGAAAVALVTIVSSIISLIPYLIEQIGVGIIRLCEVIAGGAAAICKAATVIIIALVDALVASVPAIAAGALELVVGVLDALVSFTPKIVDGLFQFLIAIIDGLARNIPDLIQSLVNLFMSIFKGAIDALRSIDPDILVNGVIAIGIMAGIMAALAAMALLAPAAMVGVLAMGAVITELAIVLAAIGSLAQLPGLTWLVGEGGKLMQSIGTAIGGFVGGIVGGFMGGVSSQFPQIATDLSEFMKNAQPFIDGAKKIDASMMNGVKALVDIIIALTAVDIIDGLTSWFTGGSSLASFGKELAEFGPYFRQYYDSITGIDGSVITASANAAKALTEMASTVPNEGGVVSWFAGDNSISKFGNDLVDLGKGLKGFSDEIIGINPEAMVTAAQAAKALTDMASTVPNEGGVVSWFAGDNSIAKFGNDLVDLGKGLKGFSDEIIGINPEAIVSAAEAAKVLAEMTSHIPDSGGVVSWFAGDNSIAQFGGDLVNLGKGLKGFSDEIVGINPEALIAASNAAKALAEMTSHIPNSGGVASWFAGDNSISKFGADLVNLGRGLKGFSDEIAGINPENVMAASSAAKALAEMASYIPNEGGVISWFTGESSISKFSTDLIFLGQGMKGFSDELSGINTENMTAAATAAKALAEMVSYIPNEGGVISWFTGESSISKFGTDLSSLGRGMKGFSDAVAGITVENVTAAANSAKALAEMTSYIPNTGGIGAWFSGEQSMSAFANELPALGKGIKGFSDSVIGIVPANVTAAANAAKTIAGMVNDASAITSSDTLLTFGDNLVVFGGDLKSYFDKTKSITVESASATTGAIKAVKESISGLDPDGVKAASNALRDIVHAVNEMANVKSSAANGFSTAIKKLGDTNVESLLKSFENAGPKLENAGRTLVEKFVDGVEGQNQNVRSAGEASIEEFVDGIDNKESTATKACTGIIDSCITAINDQIGKFSTAGGDVVKGFANGISENTYIATARARAMAKAAANAAKEELDINSPSKVFRKIGTSVPEGFADGIDKFAGMVKSSSINMANNAISNVKSTISRIAGIINSDIDAQPTIRPVLDLSGVRSGASSIGAMLNMGTSIGVMANVGTISSMMNNHGQNGTNGEIVSAINKLRKDLGNVGNTTYVIDGITYDDGSNINDAVATLVRAAKIERRV